MRRPAVIFFDLMDVEAPAIVIGGHHCSLGEKLPGGLGLDDDRPLDEVLLRIILVLAMHARTCPGQYLELEELAALIQCGLTPSALRSRLQRYVWQPPGFDQSSTLIEYRRTRTERFHRGGSTEGPFRLGADFTAVGPDELAYSTYLTGHEIAHTTSLPVDVNAVFAAVRGEHRAGRFGRARTIVTGALHHVLRSRSTAHMGHRERHIHIGRLYDALANTYLELGIPALGIAATERALICYRIASRTPELAAHSLLVQSYLYSQMETAESMKISYRKARRALDTYRNCQARKRDHLQRANHIGTIGARLSRLGGTTKAARHLAKAEQLAEEAGSAQWKAIWSLRRAQNAIQAGLLSIAENHVVIAHELSDNLTTSGRAALSRATTEFYLATKNAPMAAHWLEQASQMGTHANMAHQSRLVAALKRRFMKLR